MKKSALQPEMRNTPRGGTELKLANRGIRLVELALAPTEKSDQNHAQDSTCSRHFGCDDRNGCLLRLVLHGCSPGAF